MSVQCERCGDPAIDAEDASHVFCERCARIASTGARDSSELLFSLAPPPRHDRESADDLASLVRETAGIEDDDLGALLSLAPPVLPSAPPAPRRSSASAVAIAAAMVVALGSLAYAWRGTRPVIAPVASNVERAAPPIAAREQIETTRTEAPPLPTTSALPIAPAAESEAPLTPELPSRESAVPGAIALHRRPGRLASAHALPDSTAHAPHASTSQPSMPRPVRLPTRDDVRAAMDGVEGAIFQCAEGTHGLVSARVTFAGATGRAMHAEVVDSTLPPSARSCIAIALRGARVRPFAQERFIVAYPYRL
jgi:hypothetical protein